MIGLRPAFESFLLFVAYSETLTMAIIGLGLAVGAAVKDNNIASMIGPILIMPMSLFGTSIRVQSLLTPTPQVAYLSTLATLRSISSGLSVPQSSDMPTMVS